MGETLAILTDEVCAALDAALSEASHAGRDIQDSAQSAASAVAAFAAAVHRSAGADVAVVSPGATRRLAASLVFFSHVFVLPNI